MLSAVYFYLFRICITLSVLICILNWTAEHYTPQTDPSKQIDKRPWLIFARCNLSSIDVRNAARVAVNWLHLHIEQWPIEKECNDIDFMY